MNVNWRYVLGGVTILGVAGLTVYAIRASKKQKEVEEESMSVEEAFAEVKARRERDFEKEIDMIHETNEEYHQKMEELIDDAREEADFNASFLRPPTTKEDYIIGSEETDALLEKPEFFFTDVDFEKPLAETMTEEDKVLRYEPSSNEARNQFIRMELAEWVPSEDTYLIMLGLFNQPFNPSNDGDWDLKTRIIDYRVDFFGFESRWSKEVTFADVILHYARAAVFNIGEDMRYWVNYFLEFNEFDITTPNEVKEELIESLNNHVYYNQERDTYGLFGLTKDSMNGAMAVANLNIDKSITYEIEFNEFLKACI